MDGADTYLCSNLGRRVTRYTGGQFCICGQNEMTDPTGYFYNLQTQNLLQCHALVPSPTTTRDEYYIHEQPPRCATP